MRRIVLAATASLVLIASAAQSQDVNIPKMPPNQIANETNAASSSGGFTILLLFLILLLISSAQGDGYSPPV